LGALISAGSRLWGYNKVPDFKWRLIYCLSLIGSISLFAIIVLKVYKKHHGPYLGLILINATFLALYKVYIADRIALFY
jgi:hypothetical protein